MLVKKIVQVGWEGGRAKMDSWPLDYRLLCVQIDAQFEDLNKIWSKSYMTEIYMQLPLYLWLFQDICFLIFYENWYFLFYFTRCQQWLTNVRRTDLYKKSPEALNKSNTLCELHFKPSCFSSTGKVRKVLLKGAIPDIFDFPVISSTSSSSEKSNPSGRQRPFAAARPDQRVAISLPPDARAIPNCRRWVFLLRIIISVLP